MAVRLLICICCNREFAFTESEQKYFAEKGYEEPKRCPKCRTRKKDARNQYQTNDGNRQNQDFQNNRQQRTYKVNCYACGTETTVNFRPSLSNPAFCSGCNQGIYRKKRRF